MSTMYKANMFVVTLFVLVCVVSGKVNNTGVSSSRMAWMKGLLDHHDWMDILNGNHTVPEQCEVDLRQYITALNGGSLWASKSKLENRQADLLGLYAPYLDEEEAVERRLAAEMPCELMGHRILVQCHQLKPILVLKCDQGFVGPKGVRLECNKANYETIQVIRGPKGAVYFKGQNGKYWHADSESVTCDSDSPQPFHLELREPTRLAIRAASPALYLAAAKNGNFRLASPDLAASTHWEY